jgi:S1-C subfamily serine protease
MVDHLREERPIRSIEVEWRLMPLATARKLNLPETWASRYEAHNAQRRELLAVSSTVAGSPAERVFRAGDILLGVDGRPVNTFREVERATQSPTVRAEIFRDGRELEVEAETVALDGIGIDRVVLWAGALLQTPHRELGVQRGLAPGGVYVSFFNFGSPASRSGLFAGRRIVAINGEPTPDLDTFVEVVTSLGEGASGRINTVSPNDVPEVITLAPDDQYWPSYELRRDGATWQRFPLD